MTISDLPANAGPAVLVDGAPTTAVDVRDRGLHYGDGLFETMAVRDGALPLWERHLARLSEGCRRLGIPLPLPELLREEAIRLAAGQGRAVLKLIVTRGAGARGYQSPPQPAATRILMRHPAPEWPARLWREGVQVRLCRTRLGRNRALGGLKHLNRLEQVLARREWSDEAVFEGLMSDESGRIFDGTMSNVFIRTGNVLRTPATDACGVSGVMREHVLEAAGALGLDTAACDGLAPEALQAADEMFLTGALLGVLPVRCVAGHRLAVGPVARQLAASVASVCLAPRAGEGAGTMR